MFPFLCSVWLYHCFSISSTIYWSWYPIVFPVFYETKRHSWTGRTLLFSIRSASSCPAENSATHTPTLCSAPIKVWICIALPLINLYLLSFLIMLCYSWFRMTIVHIKFLLLFLFGCSTNMQIILIPSIKIQEKASYSCSWLIRDLISPLRFSLAAYQRYANATLIVSLLTRIVHVYCNFSICWLCYFLVISTTYMSYPLVVQSCCILLILFLRGDSFTFVFHHFSLTLFCFAKTNIVVFIK